MPKNKGKGGKSKRKGKNTAPVTKELIKKGVGQEYGQVIKLLGSCRLEVKCFDGTTRLGHIKGKIKKRTWIIKDDVVLVDLRDYQNDKCDVVGKYSLQEIQMLKKLGEISASFAVPENSSDNEDDMSFDDDEFLTEAQNDSESISSESSDEEISDL
jgi:translation initiation factor 1A